mgnify:CR=1 FL=1
MDAKWYRLASYDSAIVSMNDGTSAAFYQRDPEKFRELRQLAPDSFFLVPGIGAQGGDLEAVARHGMNDHCGLLVNSSRGIIYAGQDEDFAEAARASAQQLQQQMVTALATYLP